MVDMMMGEEGSDNDEATASPMWKFLDEEYDYKRPKRGDIRYAEVLRIDEKEIIVDIGGKTEGVVPSADLDRMGDEALAEIEVGDKVPVYVLRPESADGDVIVSLNMARTMEDWRRAEKLFEDGEVFEGTIAGYNKGGLLVYFGQIRGFVPSSQLSGLSRRSSHEDRMGMLSKMEGQELLLKVIEVDRQRRRLIFSERAASREWREQRKDELLDELQEGDIRTGSVRNLCDFGAFVDLGGADGLIHISELSWRRVKHAREVLRVGEEVEVYVLRVDRDRKRIGLSLKRLQPDPWHVAEEKYEVGQIVKSVVTNIVDFGAFARIEDGIEGLVHVSELSDGDFAPRDLVREGEELYVKILSIDADRQRMGLSLRQAPAREEIEGDAEVPEEPVVEAEDAVAEAEVLEESFAEVEEGAPEAEEEPRVAPEVAVEPKAEEEPTVSLELGAGALATALGEETVAALQELASEDTEPEVEIDEITATVEEVEAELESEDAVLIEAESETVEELEGEVPVDEMTETEPELEAEAVDEVPVDEKIETEPELEAEAVDEVPVDEKIETEPELEAEAVDEVPVDEKIETEPELEAEAVDEVPVDEMTETEPELEAEAGGEDTVEDVSASSEESKEEPETEGPVSSSVEFGAEEEVSPDEQLDAADVAESESGDLDAEEEEEPGEDA
jgi:small subunit ribosomal protein S1